MWDSGKRTDLLEKIRQDLHCMYLSDLRFQPIATDALRLALTMEASSYSVEEWKDALSYIMNQEIGGSTVEEVKETARASGMWY